MQILAKLCSIILLINVFSFALVPDTLWTRVYGGLSNDMGMSVQNVTDGGYIIAGYTGIPDDVWLIKTNANGDTLWTKTYGGADRDLGHAVQQTSDGGYIIVGATLSFGAGNYDVYLIKTDTNGDIQWTKTYGGVGDDRGFSVQQTSDGGYIITGWTYSFGAGINDVYLIKTDANGDTIWTKTYGGIEADCGSSVQQTADGGYIIAGYTVSFGVGGLDIYFIKTNSSGDTLWTKTYGGTLNDGASAVQQTSDEGYIMAGRTASFGAGAEDVYLIKTDANGNTLWTKTYGGSADDYGNSVQLTSDDGYIIIGGTLSFGGGAPSSVYIVKTDNNGNTIWTRTCVGYENAGGNSGRQTTDKGYIIVGWTNLFNEGWADVYLIRLTPDSLITDDPLSLAYNGNRHLVRQQNSQILNLVYAMEGYIIYTKSPTGGTSWDALKNLGVGKFPALTLSSNSLLPSVAWTDDNGGLWYATIQPASGIWNRYHLHDPWQYWEARVNAPPSIIVTPSVQGDTVHILATLENRHNGVIAGVAEYAFPTGNPTQGQFVYIEGGSSPNHKFCYNPSITKDYQNMLHAVWQRGDTICYATRAVGQTWSNYGWQFYNQGLHSAYPFIESYGDSVWIVWQHKALPASPEEVWRARRYLPYIRWYWTNLSQTSTTVSLFPVNASGLATTFVDEQVPPLNDFYEIYWKRISGDPLNNISQTQSIKSIYPQTSLKFNQMADNELYVAWQEGSTSPYLINCDKVYVPDLRYAFFTSGSGDSLPSPYLADRDTFFNNWAIPVDAGYNTIAYRFYLEPGYFYKLKAIAYHENGGSWKGRIKVDNLPEVQIIYNAQKPETLEVWIPPLLYQDSVVSVTFKKVSGSYAALGPLYIYRYEDEGSEGGQGGPMAQQSTMFDNFHMTTSPNPFDTRLKIDFACNKHAVINLNIYDASGRLVKKLYDGYAVNDFSLSWQGDDFYGNRTPQGIYFVQIKNLDDETTVCKKVVKLQ